MENTDSTTQQSVLNYQCYSYVSIFEKIQPLLKDGYRFDLESNAGFPQNFGTVFTFTVIKDESKPEVKSVEIAEKAVQEPVVEVPEVVAHVKPEGTRRSKQRG